MDIRKAVWATDRVNRDRILIPASELMSSYQREVQKSIQNEITLGLPMNMQHDMHRLVGWFRPLGLYIDSSMVRAVGQTEKPTLDAEKASLESRVDKFWARHQSDGAEPYKTELIDRLAEVSLEGSKFLTIESALVSRTGIAAELYPDLFTPGRGLVDKDGLADYRDLLLHMKQVQPGVFHDPERNLLLFAHRFLRRSLSHRNKLNTYFLQSFIDLAEKNRDLRVRIKLDPDIVGHPDSAKELIEMEYWHGPHYSDDIAKIPSGVAEHKASERTREFQGIDRTHIWWKDPETRVLNGEEQRYRTFEIEELIENESWGIGIDKFGCRYAHAEFSADDTAITHFDGAIRAYGSEAYFKRIETSIDKAGKHSEYTKVFRLDGKLPISDWKRVLSDYFQGNPLIPEYLGASAEIEGKTTPPQLEADIEPVLDEPKLMALIALDAENIVSELELYPELYVQLQKNYIKCVEVGVGAVEVYLRSRINLEMISTIGFEDGILNLSRLCFGPTDEPNAFFQEVVSGLSEALRQDTESGLIQRASIPLTWRVNGLRLSLTIAGDADLVVEALLRLSKIIDVASEPSSWVQAVAALVKDITSSNSNQIAWSGVNRGVIEIARTGNVDPPIRMLIPEFVRQELIESGSLNANIFNEKAP